MAGSDWLTKELKIASSPYREFNRQNNPDAYDAIEGTDLEPAGKDPAEVIEQLELPIDLVNRLKIRKGAKDEQGIKYPMPIIESQPGLHDGIGPDKNLFDIWGKYGSETIQANVNNPRMDIMLPFQMEETDDAWGEAENEELLERGWSSRPNQKDMQISSTIPGDILNPMSREEWQRFLQSNPNVLKTINSAKSKLKL